MSDNNNQTVSYTKKQLAQFKRELKKAGGFDELMFEKGAFERRDNSILISKYHDKQNEYKEKFLVGEYESLRPYFNSEVPYVFWTKLYKAVKDKFPKIK